MKVAQLLTKGYDILKNNNIESYMLDTQLLLCNVLKVDKLYIMLNRDKDIENEKVEKFLEFIKLRSEKMPIKYILGETEFMGINLNVKEGVLIPRPDTEILVEECIKIIENNNLKDICDLCCGSGAIGLSIAYHTKNTNINLYDISSDAIEVTGDNIKKLNMDERCHLEFSNLLEKSILNKIEFDMIVSNPPYIRRDVIPNLMDDVKNYEPHLALDGGEDGLIFYRKIAKQSKNVLRNNGYIAFEIGHDQKEAVMEILEIEGFSKVYSLKDLYENDRVVIGQK
ncbi:MULTISPECIES: peptide chain release factor N(5)-glutamine methyltransferase [Clostridium]|uniref:Release factor glutamine methyltransferase n=1 Tax=Clostridium senegalense TaxID=1465809 RepID=A0A6M0H364_9CLOT|nr:MULTISPECIES: peptide chain release factor N(5)-glutamine methyltransferase [Clostridium]NEU04072.1 peptide chain release factor N(5)-glutamine methyltransferase [Clostridium senegalense]